MEKIRPTNLNKSSKLNKLNKLIEFYELKLLICLLAVGLSACTQDKSFGAKGLSELDKLKPSVILDQVKRGTIAERHVYTGFLYPWKKADLAPSMPGKISKILVKEGELVSKGQLLVEMDNTQLINLQAQFDLAKSNYDRIKTLHESGAISAAKFEQAKAAYIQAKRGLKSVSENTKLTAPFRGVISAIAREEGEIYSLGMRLPGGINGLIQVIDRTSIKVDVQVSENIISKIKTGTAVQLTVKPIKDRVFQGKVYFVNPSADNLSRTFKISVKIDNRTGELYPGFYGQVALILDEKPNVIQISNSAIIDDKYVFVFNDGRVHKKEVKVGIKDLENMEILYGLTEQDRVVVSGNSLLIDGTEVSVEKGSQ